MAKQFDTHLHIWNGSSSGEHKTLETRVLNGASDVKEVYSWIREQLGKDLSAKQMQIVAFAGKLSRGERVEFHADDVGIIITRMW